MSDDEETGMQKGTMLWNGYPNMLWVRHTPYYLRLQLMDRQWVDRKAGVCGLYANQLVPAGDAKVVKLQRAFQKETYEQGKRSKL